jgi:hypothetical protein
MTYVHVPYAWSTYDIVLHMEIDTFYIHSAHIILQLFYTVLPVTLPILSKIWCKSEEPSLVRCGKFAYTDR